MADQNRNGPASGAQDRTANWGGPDVAIQGGLSLVYRRSPFRAGTAIWTSCVRILALPPPVSASLSEFLNPSEPQELPPQDEVGKERSCSGPFEHRR